MEIGLNRSVVNGKDRNMKVASNGYLSKFLGVECDPASAVGLCVGHHSCFPPWEKVSVAQPVEKVSVAKAARLAPA